MDQTGIKTDAHTAPHREAVQQWAYLLGGISLVAVLGGAAWFTIIMARRRKRLRNLQQDWKTRRLAEQDAWSESARRMTTPTSEQLEEPGKKSSDEPDGDGPGSDSGGERP